jgi:hypothetical protein
MTRRFCTMPGECWIPVPVPQPPPAPTILRHQDCQILAPVWPTGGLPTLDLPGGKRVHFDDMDCLIRFGRTWRGASDARFVALGLEPPGLRDLLLKGSRPMHAQSRLMSFLESVTNVVVGFLLTLATQFAIFPWLGMTFSVADNVLISRVFTAVSIGRSFALRRLFDAMHTRRGNETNERNQTRVRHLLRIQNRSSPGNQ